MILIKKVSENEFKITINSSISTAHNVILTDEVYQNLTKGKISKEELLNFSFKFLLDREPNTSILSSFKLKVISQYFPEYEQSVKNFCK